ncbi:MULTISPECIES: amino acid ABC transporter substrate-binding protein [unclassified Romboutsia]|uniref:amino acid ABC transporter substrate-binding protein n=1 Tax=unclassified Romboutsia TaxID=2626894 RepID=UPI000822C234|nr:MULTISPECIES: amino acid ABC transporter substrate-binding protein [unclassified Romboutsia]SCH64931.1 Glutamine-binding periplasmic protein precursor [uncultured Clostridium sp.]
MKKNILKKIVITTLSIIYTSVLVGCSNINEKSNNEMVIGYDNTFVPMGFLDGKGNTVGFDVDLANEVGKRLNMNIKFQSIDWSMKEAELNSGNIDAIWNGYTLTEERKSKVAYTDSYLDNKQIIVTLKSFNINSKSDLKNKTVGTQSDSAGMEAVLKDTSFVDSINNKEPVLYDTFDNAFRDLEIGRIDALVADEVLARYYISQKDQDIYSILNDDFGTEVFVVGFKKDNTELRDKVNTALNEIKKDNTFDDIYSKWFK